MQEFLYFAIIKLVPRQNGLLFTKINKHAVYRATFNCHGKFLGKMGIWFLNMLKKWQFSKRKNAFWRKRRILKSSHCKVLKTSCLFLESFFPKISTALFEYGTVKYFRIIPILIGIKVVYTSIRTGTNVHIYIHAETQKHLQTRWSDDHEYDYCLNISFYVPVYFYWRD